MLVLAFTIDGARYGIEATDVELVTPMPPLRRLDGAPPWVAGVLPMFGRLLPVLDLSLLHAGRPCKRAYGTRIVVVRCDGPAESPLLVGLAAEQVIDVVDVDASRLQPAGVAQDAAPWLGLVADDPGGGLLQLVSPRRLLTDEVRATLMAHAG